MITFDFAKTPITKIVDAIIINSSKSGSSDIHFDPREDGLIVRIRVDGDLMDYTFIPKVYERNLTTRLKLMAGMNITESRLPQDGAIKGKFDGKDLDMRVSSLPTNEGEKIVIRILDYSRSLSGIDKLGFNSTNFAKLKNMIAAPNGIILVTGATGSGKSTTTYSILQVLNKERTNIITVEDPIEMNIEGMNQVQVNSEIGLDFATVLRSILRQDPNVILIGEIRDSETAKIAVRASITGHLVLSTLHTNNSLSTIERLLDMDVERYLLSTALTGIISQRLAKTVCTSCRKKRPTTPYEKKVFKLALKKDIEEIYDANHDGCPKCNKGYHGRIAIQEVLEIDDDIRNILANPNVRKEDLKRLVYGSGNVITLLQDGLQKILEGFTTFEEIYRIIEIDNDINDSCYESFTKAVTEEQRIELDKKRTKELNELKRLESVSATKVANDTSSIVDKKQLIPTTTMTPSNPTNININPTSAPIVVPPKDSKTIATQAVVKNEGNVTPLNPNKENIKPVPTQQPQIKSENKPVTPTKKEATPPIVVTPKITPTNPVIPQVINTEKGVTPPIVVTPKITPTNPVIPQVINTKKEVTPISITPLMPNKSA